MYYYEDKCHYCNAPDTCCEHWQGTFCDYDAVPMEKAEDTQGVDNDTKNL